MRLSLNGRGALFDTLIGAARQRNAFLLHDLPANKRAIFLAVTEHLIRRARRMMGADPAPRR